jgi:hypothetical protein
MQKAILMSRDTWFMDILNCAYALCTCLAQPSLLAICLAAVWEAKSLITSATKHSLRVLVHSGFSRIHFLASATKCSGSELGSDRPRVRIIGRSLPKPSSQPELLFPSGL